MLVVSSLLNEHKKVDIYKSVATILHTCWNVPNPAGTTWRRRAAVTTWTKETTAGRSFTPTSSGSRRTRACSAPCWVSGRSSSLSPPVSCQTLPTRFKQNLASGLENNWTLPRVPTGIIVMALFGMFNVHHHGSINSAAIVLYALTSCVSGYVSCSFYTQINGQRWVWNIILTSSLFSGESREHQPIMLTDFFGSIQLWVIWLSNNSSFRPSLCFSAIYFLEDLGRKSFDHVPMIVFPRHLLCDTEHSLVMNERVQP